MVVLLSKFEQGKITLTLDVKKVMIKVLKKMNAEQINIEGWTLDEHPLDTIYCFYHPGRKQAFDILVSDNGNLVPYYSGKATEEGINSFPALTIQEAIKNYILE
ncbi:TPA: hypothetical protein ACQK1M_002318 [Enterococcus hirae]